MQTDEVLTLIIEGFFALLLAVAAWRYRRERSAVNLYLMLMFGPLAALLVTRALGLAGLDVPDPVAVALTLFLLAQPLFALGLATRFSELPRVVLPGAVAALVVTGGPLLVLRADAPPLLLVAVVTVFASIEVIAATVIYRSVGPRTGAARTRRQIVAWSTVLLGVAIVVAGLGAAETAGAAEGAASRTLVVIAQLLALGSGIGYLVAMLPPGRLSRAWQAVAAYPEVGDLLALSDEPAIWARLATAAARTTGADDVLIARPGSTDPTVLTSVGLDAEAGTRLMTQALEALDRVAGGRGRAHPGWVAFVPDRGDGHALAIRPVSDEPRSPLLVTVSRHPPLFPEDGRAMLGVLFQEATRLAERAALLETQERLAAELRATVEELERASVAKSEFLASMSHELRTPLNAIIGFSDLMREEGHEDGSLHIPAEWAEHVQRGGQHLLALINDILDLSKVEAGRLDLDPSVLDLSRVVDQSVDAIRPLATRKGHDVRTAIPDGLTVTADRARFRQVLYNLLSNAIKYTPDGGVIRVEAAESEDEVSVSVIDTGIGIPLEDQARIFEAFWQARSTAGAGDGTGLGLSLSRRLMEAHGGRLAVESAVGEGSRFTAHFQRRPVLVATEAVPDPVAPPPTVPGPSGGRVLLVEDDASTVRLLRTYLEPAGYAVSVVARGEEAVAMARTTRPDVVLLDVLLPDIDGWEVLRRLKSDPTTDAIPVVFESVVDEPGVGIALGAADYLLKPLDRGRLLAAVERAMRPAHGEPPLRRVLAVDDEPADLEVVSATLRAAGYEVTAVTSGSEALEFAAEARPDVIICDLIMPPPDGFEVIATLRDDPATARIPIIVLTAHDLSREERARLNHRVVTVLAKTCERSELLEWLARLMPREAA